MFVAAGASVFVSAPAFAGPAIAGPAIVGPAIVGAAVTSALPRRGPLSAADNSDEIDVIAAH